MRKIIIDTDPGIDDAVALALALFNRNLQVELITTVAGNAAIDHVTRNALQLLNFYGKQVPVARGAQQPLLEKFRAAAHIHGATGLDGFSFPPLPAGAAPLQKHAVEAMNDCLGNAEEQITLVALGPLSNLALLFSLYPRAKERIREIVLMGGSTGRGNKSPLGEFNIATDPEAAAIVFASGLPITMVGLDVGDGARLRAEHCQQIKNMHKVGHMFYSLFQKYRGGSLATGLTMYDCFAIAYLLVPDIFVTAKTFVTVELAGAHSRGATVVDLQNCLGQPANCNVCLSVDAAKFSDWLLAEIKGFQL